MSLSLALGLFLQVAGGASVVIDRARLDPKAEIGFHAVVSPETVYVGDAVLYELGVFVSEEVRSRLRRNPQYVPPELRAVLAYDLRGTKAGKPLVRDGRSYDVHIFRRALFPVAPGRITIPPAKLSYDLPVGSSFFSREEPRNLESEAVTFVAIPPPLAGRPPTWSGAVGDLRVSLSVTGNKRRVGDPFVVTVRVSGESNVNLLPRPLFGLQWASVVPSAERVTIDTAAATVRGSKEFDWLVTPTVEGREDIPALEYAYFDPAARQYKIARSEPSTIAIGEGSLAAVDTTGNGAGRRARTPLAEWTKPSHDAPDRTIWYWVIMLVAPIPAVARIVRERPRRRPARTPEGALHALAVAGVVDATRVRRGLHDALHTRLGADSIPWADPSGIRRALRRHGVTDETVQQVMALVTQLDAAAYGVGDGAVPGGAKRALDVYDRINDEARGVRRGLKSGSGVAAALLLFVALGGAAGMAQTAMSPMQLFVRGMRAYSDDAPAAAAADFFDAARAEPFARAAWLNAGSASWAASDTGRAVVGWQRALRLDPMDDNVRTLLTRVGADAGAGTSTVWPVPRRLPAWFAIVLWVGGWVVIWKRRERFLAPAAVVFGAALATISVLHHRRLADPRIVVMASPAPLRALPALGADAGAVPLTGELLTVIDRNGVWVRVTAPGDRLGWIDAARVLDLDGRPLRN